MCQLHLERTTGLFVGRSKIQVTAKLLLAIPDLEEKPNYTKLSTFKKSFCNRSTNQKM
jgi:hypothetical protein